MGLAFLLLLLGSAAITTAAILPTLRARRRGRPAGEGAAATLGAGQAVVGVLWIVWGVAYRQSNGGAGGVFAAALGALMLLQGGRRVLRTRR